MVGKLVDEAQVIAKLDRKTLDIIYQHTWFLANFRFARPIEVLQSRHSGYSKEDFVQEVVTLMFKHFESGKTFPTVNHLKKIIHKTMEFHYLKEKRKYFWTKSRGGVQCTSLDESVNDYRKIGDTIMVETEVKADSMQDFRLFLDKDLYVAYDWVKPVVITKEEFRDYQGYYLMSVNKFIEKQRDLGVNETCKSYKTAGCYITKSIFEQISQSIIDYAKEHKLLEIEEEHTYVPSNRYIGLEDKLLKGRYTCPCGHYHSEHDESQLFWQCPVCGRVHNKLSLYEANQSEESLKEYAESVHTNSYTVSTVTNLRNSIHITDKEIEDARNNLIKHYDNDFNYTYNNSESLTNDILDTSDDLIMV